MSAKATDLARVQEMFNLVTLTQLQIEELSITEQRFKRPETTNDQLLVEALMNRVFRITEEAGALSDEALEHYDFERRALKGVRNRLAHAYGEVNADLVWEVIETDFPRLLEGCQAFCDDQGFELELPADVAKLEREVSKQCIAE